MAPPKEIVEVVPYAASSSADPQHFSKISPLTNEYETSMKSDSRPNPKVVEMQQFNPYDNNYKKSPNSPPL